MSFVSQQRQIVSSDGADANDARCLHDFDKDSLIEEK